MVPRPTTLVVPPTSAASFYDTQDLVFSRSPGTRGYYQFNSWTERPGRAIHELLVARLEGSGLVQAEITFRFPADAADPAALGDAFVLAFLFPAMSLGRDLHICANVSP